MTTPHDITSAEKVVAELRLAVTRDQYCSGTTTSHATAAGLLALIESQRATIERVERERDRLVVERDGSGRAYVEQMLAVEAAEARVTALEAEKAGAVKLGDGYGIVLMMIAAGCSDPQRFAKRMLAEYAPEAKKIEATK